MMFHKKIFDTFISYKYIFLMLDFNRIFSEIFLPRKSKFFVVRLVIGFYEHFISKIKFPEICITPL